MVINLMKNKRILLITIIVVVLINKPKGNNEKLLIKKEVAIEINQTATDEMFFSTKNPDLNNVKIIYPDNFNTSEIGSFEISISVGEDKFTSKLNVIDTTSPELILKELNLKTFRNYNINDFIESCKDNSNKECNIDFFQDALDENGNAIKYSSFKDAGTYEIKIIAKDASGNEVVKSTKLTIGGNQTEEKICEYGGIEYDTNKYILTSNVSNGNCALNPTLYNDETITKNVNKLLATETIRIKKDIESLKLDGTIALNRTINIIMNNSSNGLVGYEVIFTATVSNNGKSQVVCEYKIDSDGKRVFISNKYNLDN